MVDRLPSGTRDVLPDEMGELRAMTDRIRGVFERAGYGELYTPALEYETDLPRASGPRPAYRVFDENGHVLVLRADMTVPIARVAATRYSHVDPPLRFCYIAHAYRGVRPQRGQSREFLQAGIELIGAPGPEGTAEVLGVLCAALEAAGLEAFRVGVGDASLYPSLLESFGVADTARERVLTELVGGDFVGVEREVRELGLSDAQVELLLRVARTRGGPDVLEEPPGMPPEILDGMRSLHGLLEPRVAERVIFDLGLVRSLGYYTGAVFQVYDPAYGVPVGSGGRYDELLGLFGRPLPAVGFALNVERLHIALTGEEGDRAGARSLKSSAGAELLGSEEGNRAGARSLESSAGAELLGSEEGDRAGARSLESSAGAGTPGLGGVAVVTDLRIAVPRGALLIETLDLLDRLGIDTSEVRSNDRKLLFEEPGIITMRPSDVPTYVEAGAADIGITGKDVLMEQSEREVYELVDLGYGACTMVLATVDGPDRAAEALRRLGVVRIATKYPRIAARHFLDTGRQAEIVEVKGSVELAPLTGLVEGIVDLTATGTTLRENGLVVREEIARCTARLIANPVAHKLRASAIDALLERLRGV